MLCVEADDVLPGRVRDHRVAPLMAEIGHLEAGVAVAELAAL